MRIWSLHPKYIDTKGLTALWRETLLAKHVLEGKTKGYKNHPQLQRFYSCQNPLNAINYYLEIVWKEAQKRNFNYNQSKFIHIAEVPKITVTKGQLEYERKHLLQKLSHRDLKYYNNVIHLREIETHPLFTIIEGNIESWEKIY